jgi:hypothetical protein
VAKAALAKGSRISGAQRTTLASQYAKRYSGGESIRKIAEDAGRSYGFVHNVLKESGVSLRGRGGATRGTRKTASSSRPPAKRTSKATSTLEPATESAPKGAKGTKGTKKAATSAKGTAEKVATTAKAVAKKAAGKTTAKKAPARTTKKVAAQR